MGLIKENGAREGSAGDGVVEGFGLGLCGWWSDEGVWNFIGMANVREDMNFVCYSAAKVVEGFTDVRRIVVSFVGVLGAMDMLSKR